MHVREGGAAANSDRKCNARSPHEGRHVRTPLFPETSVGFPDPISGELRGVVRLNFFGPVYVLAAEGGYWTLR